MPSTRDSEHEAGHADPAGQTLPDGFLVGASTAAHQIEGGNVNSTWWMFEHRDGTPIEEPSGDAADSYHRWPDDLDLVADLGLDAYRFSLEWARIEPERGFVSRAALQHYRRMIDGALDRGIEPVVTLHHFTEPRWFWEAGGWAAPDATESFVRYVTRVAPILDGVRWVVTINEPNIASIMARLTRRMDAAERLAEQERDIPGAPLPAPHTGTASGMAAAHHAACDALRPLLPDARLGWSIASQVIQSVTGGEDTAARFEELVEDVFLRESRGDDFVGVQSYTRTVFGPDGPVRNDPEDTRTQMGWEYWPDALGHAVRHTAEVLGDVPILVTENGIATADDERRIAYTTGALAGLTAAMRDGVDVRGYLHWSLLDNYEWGSFAKTFGLVSWDPETFDRMPKASAHWLGRVARERRIPWLPSA